MEIKQTILHTDVKATFCNVYSKIQLKPTDSLNASAFVLQNQWHQAQTTSSQIILYFYCLKQANKSGFDK